MVRLSATVSVCVLLGFSVAFISCKKKENERSERMMSPAPQLRAPVPRPTSLEDVALEKAMENFRAHWQQCGDSYLSIVERPGSETRIEELKGPRPYFPDDVNKPLTEADRLNGLTWKGVVFFNYGAMRRYDAREKSWSEWRPQGTARTGYWWLEITDKDGKWECKPWSPDQDDAMKFRKPLDCDKAPEINNAKPT